MADCEITAKLIYELEGGYSDNKLDRGGRTNHGITWGTYYYFYKEPNLDKFMKMDYLEWFEIFYHGYWNACNASNIKNQSVANLIVDWNFNSGIAVNKRVQKLLGVKEDGVFGTLTMNALNSADQRKLFDDIMLIRRNYYNMIVTNKPSQKIFLKGWKSRLNKIKYHE